jgi:ATP synthase protein I
MGQDMEPGAKRETERQTDPERALRERVAQQARMMRDAERNRPTMLAQTVYLGTLAVLFILPVVLGAYLGSWLDARMAGYSVRWTVSLILIGVFVGALDVYLFVRERH